MEGEPATLEVANAMTDDVPSAPSSCFPGTSAVPQPAVQASENQQLRDLSSAPRLIRTADLLIRSQTLYPTELWARGAEPGT